MTSKSTREFMAMCAIAHGLGRPGIPTDQAWIESLFSHIKADWPHLDAITDPAVLRAELAVARVEYNTVRRHAGIGYITPDDEHEGPWRSRASKISRAAFAAASSSGSTTNSCAGSTSPRLPTPTRQEQRHDVAIATPLQHARERSRGSP